MLENYNEICHSASSVLTSIAMQKKRRKPEASLKRNIVIRAFPDQIKAWIATARTIDATAAWWVRRVLNAAAIGHFRVKFTDPQVERNSFGLSNQEIVKQFQIKATQAEQDAWKEAAVDQGLERTEWCRQVLDAAVDKDDQSFLFKE